MARRLRVWTASCGCADQRGLFQPGLWTALCCAILGLVALTAEGALAQSPRLIGQYDDWASYKIGDSQGDVCYVLAQATSKTPPRLDHGDIYLMVSRRPKEKIKGEVMLRVGYHFKPGAAASAKIGAQNFVMYTRADGAWVREASDEAELLKAMRAGAHVDFKGTSLRGNATGYRFSLKGVSAALDAINKACP
jgi:invasion protein IalB